MGSLSISFLRYEPLKNDVTIFDPFSGLKTRFRHFPTGGLLVCKNFFKNGIQCVVEASGFRLNHNMTLESKKTIHDTPKQCKISVLCWK